MKKYINSKFFVSTIFGAIAVVFAGWFVNWAWKVLIFSNVDLISVLPNGVVIPTPAPEFIITWNVVIGSLIFSYFVSYVHELIPHCNSSFWVKWYKFGILVSLGISGLILMSVSLSNWVLTLYVLDLAFGIGLSLAAVVIYVLYKFEPGKSVKENS